MQLAMIGLGRMGGNMSRRLVAAGHQLVVYDTNPEAGEILSNEMDEVTRATSYFNMINKLSRPRVIWLMVPHQYVDTVIAELLTAGLQRGDLIVDGGNSNYHDGIKRGQTLAAQGMLFADCGTSGGVWGLKNGYSLMIGGSDEAIALLTPVLTSLASNEGQGWGHVGPVGAGHFVKMVHNGIEYGMMEAFAEGFEVLHNKDEFGLDMQQIAKIWQHGSVVSSWLLDLIGDALTRDQDLGSLSDWMDDSGEGRWTAQEAIIEGIPTPVLTLALQMRFRSRQHDTFAGKIVNAMRAGFGGHAIKAADETDNAK